MTNYQDALDLFHEWTLTDSLRRHGYAVEAAMGYYAKKLGEDEEKWRITGLLHDMDYERHQTMEEHPYVGVKYLKEKGYPEDVLDAILGHANHTGHARETLMAKVLFAVDELAGFITAVGYVRPTGLEGMKPRSVVKKLKNKQFAAAVSREDVRAGAEDLGIEFNEHIAHVIAGMQADATRLGFGSSD
ncbi:MAG: HDIG domain-containing protein [Bacteroidetes Order II. Incertae sedis bacterium]|jgi:putative nucleotidyltransferase with HDIG domain|nr:HDIG domain-containing protein [Bacteroidetes Order II. bacterium]MDG1754470.1 HDIG domain-containing protein [Rhodothermales bacterium]HAY36763.1 HAD family hydrolase [Bacteroidota bacterium]MBT4051644.1 HDIG domain-containing protein [Bacteroidetes Order II. bacterium]MBT4602573.1 HDIG domain-containing protein [Bacteroidetes Order II. bacterium]